MNALTLFDHAFEGKKITTIIYQGRPCWLAREVGEALGYAEFGRRFVRKIDEEWSKETIAGHDLDWLTGEAADWVKGIRTDSVPGRSRRVLVLFESGLWLCLAKTQMEAGVRLRRFLVDNVLPQIARDGQYSPEREVTPQGQLVEREDAGQRIALEERRLALAEAELAQRQRELALRQAELARSALLMLPDQLPHIGQDIKAMLAVKAAEVAYGRPLTALLPPADESLLSWESPSQIGERLGVTSNRVGRAISALGLKGPEGRGIEGMSRVITNKAMGSDKPVPTYLYSPEAVAQIEQYLRDNGYVTPR